MQASIVDPLLPHVEVLADLQSIWGSTRYTTLRGDTYYDTLCGPDYADTYRVLFGRAPYQWVRTTRAAVQQLRRGRWPQRWTGPKRAPVLLPDAAVAFPRKQEGLVVASGDARAVLKLFRQPTGAQRCANEARAAALARAAGVAEHVPQVYAHGAHPAGGHFLHTELAPNTRPFFQRFRRRWRRWLQAEGLPVLERLYGEAGVDERNPIDLLPDDSEENDAPRIAAALQRLVQDARPHGPVPHVPYVFNHGDLSPLHVHRTADSWALIDWGVAGFRPAWQELLVLYLRNPLHTHYDRPAFWEWLRGVRSIAELPRHAREDLQLVLHWLSRWRQFKLSGPALRFQVLVVLQRLIRPHLQTTVFDKESHAQAHHPAQHPDHQIRHATEVLIALGLLRPPRSVRS